MNKKFLSAILFGALMVTSTGTFVSCKDYDDDIDEINKELSDIKSQLSALQTKIDAGKYITNVATTADGITITLNDGTSYPITNGKDGKPGENGKPGEAGAAGDKIEVNADGYFVINGKATEWMAVKKDQLGQVVKVKTPTVSEDGCWVFYDEKGEAHPTTIKVAPVTAVENADKSWTLTVFDAEGKSQTIKVPSAASLLSEIVVASNDKKVNGATAGVTVTSYTFKKPSEWNGPRALVANKSNVYAVSGLDIRVNPVGVDVTEVPFTLVNTKNATFPQIKYAATAESGNDPLTFGNIKGRAANTGNGLWSLGMKSFILSESEAETFNKALTNADNVAYAVTAGSDTRSLYNVSIKRGDPVSLSSVQVRNMYYSIADLFPIETTPTPKDITVDVNKTYTIDPFNAEAFYDMYFTVSDLDKKTYGIVYDNEARTFTVTNRPDVVSTDLEFTLNVNTLDNNGNRKKAQYTVHLSYNMDAPASYDAVTYNIANLYNSSVNNFFNIDLDILKNSLGDNYTTWGNNVVLGNTRYYIGEKADGSDKVVLDATSHALTASIINANNATATDVNTAKNIRVTVGKIATNTLKLDKQYYLTVQFRTAASATLNSIVIPVTFTAPSVAEQFTAKAGYVVDGTINAYYYNVANKNIELNRYFDAMDTNATLKPKANDAVAKVGNTTYTSYDLATLSVGVLSLNPVEPNEATKEELGYGKVLTINASNDYYKDSYWAYSDNKKATSFTIKVMSPIAEGTITPAAGSSIKVIANAEKGYDITADMITAKDYTGVTTYNIMPDKEGDPNSVDVWKSAQIAKVSVAKKGGDNNTYIKSVEMTAYTPATSTTPAKLGTINVKAEPLPNDTPSTIIVTVEDAWGYMSAQEVAVTIATK